MQHVELTCNNHDALVEVLKEIAAEDSTGDTAVSAAWKMRYTAQAALDKIGATPCLNTPC